MPATNLSGLRSLWMSPNLTWTQIHTNRPGLSWIGKFVEPRCLKSMYCWKSMLPFFPPTSVLGPILGQDQRSNAVGPCSHLSTSWAQKAMYYELAVFLWIYSSFCKMWSLLSVLFLSLPLYYYSILYFQLPDTSTRDPATSKDPCSSGIGPWTFWSPYTSCSPSATLWTAKAKEL